VAKRVIGLSKLSEHSSEEATPDRTAASKEGEAQIAELAAVILTYNEELNIVDCIESLSWADPVVVIDCFSDDKTTELAEAAGAEVTQIPFDNFAQQRNSALEVVTSDFIFFVDADERGSQELGTEIRNVLENRKEAAWYVPRHNYIFGKLTLGAGWYPDYQLRLFKRGRVRYERPVHEIAVVDGEIGYLANPLVHINYRDTEQFHSKQRFYTDYDAGVLKKRGVHAKAYTYLTQPLRQFIWRFFTLKGYRDGVHGLRLSFFMAYYEYMKYLKLRQMWKGAKDSRGDES
jgi:hypothetical protein